MIAAIYARKSTDAETSPTEAKSVTRQVENATAFAVAKGWTVDDRTSSSTTASAAPSSSGAPASCG